MKIIKKTGSQYVLRFEYKEDFLSELKKFLRNSKIRGSFFYGLGSVIDPKLAYYNVKSRKYFAKTFRGTYEVAGLTGNSAMLKREIVVHAHSVISGRNYKALAGHLAGGKVGGTLEVFLFDISNIKRAPDKKIGLNLLE